MSGLPVVAVLAAVVLGLGLVLQLLIVRSESKFFGRRLSTPQAESATGTEAGLSEHPRSGAPQPRSPMAPVGGAADPRPVAPPAGLRRRRVVLHG